MELLNLHGHYSGPSGTFRPRCRPSVVGSFFPSCSGGCRAVLAACERPALRSDHGRLRVSARGCRFGISSVTPDELEECKNLLMPPVPVTWLEIEETVNGVLARRPGGAATQSNLDETGTALEDQPTTAVAPAEAPAAPEAEPAALRLLGLEALYQQVQDYRALHHDMLTPARSGHRR